MDIPAWITNAVSHYLDLFDLRDWRVTVVQDALEGDDDSHVMGKCISNAQYYNARLILSEDITPEQLHIITHEMLHIVLAEMQDIVGMIISATPFRQQIHFWRLYRWVEDRLIQKIKHTVIHLDTYGVEHEQTE